MREQILELRAEGKTYSEIQALLGCSKATISYHAGAGQKEKNAARGRDRRNRIRKYVQEYKQSRGCMDCGEKYPYWILQFDHLADKEFNISERSTRTFEEIVAEIEKCEVVCANCHSDRTHARMVKSGSDVGDYVPA